MILFVCDVIITCSSCGALFTLEAIILLLDLDGVMQFMNRFVKLSCIFL